MCIVDVQYNEKPDAIELTIGNGAKDVAGLLIVTALDDGTLHIGLMGSERNIGVPRDPGDIPTIEEYPF